ncbi:NrfD/PsrC family molybdoenzyme membrane anchor subunit [Marinactinospora thermotolerans]|uniref:Formate-dependent nitrite reductase, membrane component NrfD n=1 Tax=Marinactinospora thermotolerans DSM 45154 TaxID=1122192 RepID=A0A1T4T4C4_9ACTN|nr:NrfD/PsrC family molybdoenzyme membrane anchor subunit [Marinactinospora thermotolerans]SKA35354.1 Formate-dependent nitrite reductase, membrane component NrfD [Marinactinospora thermotolerans DSM 45154]
MNTSEVTREGIRGARPDHDAIPGSAGRRRPRRGGRGERLMVPKAEFRSYYGKPVLNQIVWAPYDIGGYLFLGGLAGASSVLAAGAELSGRPVLARAMKIGALGAISGSVVALVHDLGRPARFVNMLRVFKPSSPMSVGSWLLACYGPLAGAAAVTDVTGLLPRLGRAAAVGAAAFGPAVAAYTAPLICDTAVPAWHEGHREMPFVFVGSGAAAAGGLGMLAAPVEQAGPARRAALFGAALEVGAAQVMRRRMGMVAEPYGRGSAGVLMRAASALTLAGAAAGTVLGRRSRAAAATAGVALLAGSLCTRLGVFQAGVASARDPRYTVVPQRARADARDAGTADGAGDARTGVPAQRGEQG